MENVINYSSAPDADRFHEVDAAELAEIIRKIGSLESTTTTPWAREVWETDIDASTRAAELMDAFGHRVFVAQDDDGYYFATEETADQTQAAIDAERERESAEEMDARRQFWATRRPE